MNQDLTQPNQVVSTHSLPEMVEGQRLLSDLGQGLPQRIAYVGADGRCKLANRAFLDWCGRTMEQVVGYPLADVLAADDYATLSPLVEQAPDGCFWIADDSRARCENQRRQQQFERHRNVVLERIEAGADVGTVLALLKRAIEDRFPGAWVDVELSGRHGSRPPSCADDAPDAGQVSSVPIVVEPSRPVGWVSGRLAPQAAAGGQEDTDASLLCALESSAHIAAMAVARHDLCLRLAYQAQHDDLTGLPNRRWFEEHLKVLLTDAKRLGTRLALVVIDIDDFKRINDALGHAAGDELLRRFTARLASYTRDGDLIARIAGDEFVLLLRDLPTDIAAHDIAWRLCDRLKAPINLGPHEVHLYASFGISNFPNDGLEVSTLLRSADMAMSRAKSHGKKRVESFTPDLQIEASERLKLESALRRAVNREELSLHLQPQVQLATGRVLGYESLCRWVHPWLGNVPPDRFIRCAEQTGLIVPLGHWVIEEACRQARALACEGQAPARVAINVSAAQFQHGDLVDAVRRAIEANQLDARQIEIELTESVLTRDTARVADQLAALRKLGVRVAIDDFGIGYSSLSYLRELPIDVLKIDRSFISGIRPGAEQDASELVRSIIHLGHSLHLEVIAEGVETAEQAAWLREAGCEMAQGYWFGRPAPLETFLAPAAMSSAG